MDVNRTVLRPDPLGPQNHFHIYLRPPELLEIGPSLLLADNPLAMPPDMALDTASGSVTLATSLQTNAQGLLDYTQNIITGDELMFTMDVPYVPVQDTPIVLAQAASPNKTAAQPDYILNTCEVTTSLGDPRSAERAVSPAGMLAVYLQNYDKRVVDMAMLTAIKTTLLQGTKHGELVGSGGGYFYAPPPGYSGSDRAVFMAEFEGKRYKIIVDLKVSAVEALDDNAQSNLCPEPTLIKVNGKPVSGSSGYDSGYSLNSLSVTFAALDGGAVGQTPF